MKTTVQIAQLRGALNKCAAVAPKNSALAQLETIRFSVNGRMELSAGDLETAIKVTVQNTAKVAGVCNLPVGEITKLLNMLPDGELSITLDNETRRLQVQTEQGNYQITVDEFATPEWITHVTQPAECVTRLVLQPEQIKTMAMAADRFAGKDELMPKLLGVHLSNQGGVVKIEASDNVKVATLSMKGGGVEFDIVIPAKPIQLLAKNVKGPTVFILTEFNEVPYLYLQNGDTEMMVKLNTATFVDVEKVVTAWRSKHEFSATVDRAELHSAIADLLPFAPWSKRVKITPNAAATNAAATCGSHLSLEVRDPAKGIVATRTVRAEFTGEPIERYFPLDKFLPAIDSVLSNSVTIDFTALGCIMPLEHDQLAGVAMVTRMTAPAQAELDFEPGRAAAVQTAEPERPVQSEATSEVQGEADQRTTPEVGAYGPEQWERFLSELGPGGSLGLGAGERSY